MKKTTLVLILSLLFNGLFAQVNFRKIKVEEALKIASQEDKLVFVDFNAPWCMGCKIIDHEFEHEKEFAELMNKLLVCVQVDVSTEYGKTVAQQYNIKLLPTFLFLRPDGSLQHRFTAGTFIQPFAEKFWKAINPYTCYPYLNKQYQEGERSIDFLVKYIECLELMSREEEMIQVKDELWNKCSDQDKINQFSLFFRIGREEETKEMQYLLANHKQLRDAGLKDKVDNILRFPIENILRRIIYQDTILNRVQLNAWKKKAIDRKVYTKDIKSQFHIAYAVCSGKENKILKACDKKLEAIYEYRKSGILYYHFSSIKESKQIEGWLQMCKKYLPTLNEDGKKKAIEELMKKWEKELYGIQ